MANIVRKQKSVTSFIRINKTDKKQVKATYITKYLRA